MGNLADVITCAKFRDEIFWGYDFTGGSNFPFSCWFLHGPYNSSATALPVIRALQTVQIVMMMMMMQAIFASHTLVLLVIVVDWNSSSTRYRCMTDGGSFNNAQLFNYYNSGVWLSASNSFSRLQVATALNVHVVTDQYYAAVYSLGLRGTAPKF